MCGASGGGGNIRVSVISGSGDRKRSRSSSSGSGTMSTGALPAAVGRTSDWGTAPAPPARYAGSAAPLPAYTTWAKPLYSSFTPMPGFQRSEGRRARADAEGGRLLSYTAWSQRRASPRYSPVLHEPGAPLPRYSATDLRRAGPSQSRGARVESASCANFSEYKARMGAVFAPPER